MKVKLSRLKHRASVGMAEEIELPNGNNVDEFVKQFDIWFGYYRHTLTEELLLSENHMTEDVWIVTKDRRITNSDYLVHIDDTDYKVKSITPDDELNSCLLIQLTAVV